MWLLTALKRHNKSINKAASQRTAYSRTKLSLLVSLLALSGCRVTDPAGQLFYEKLVCGLSSENVIQISSEYGAKHYSEESGIHDFMFTDEQFFVYFNKSDRLSGVDRTVVKRFLWKKSLEKIEVAMKCTKDA